MSSAIPIANRKNLGVLIERLSFAVALILFRVALDVSFVRYLNPEFGNHFLTPMILDFSWVHYLLSWLFLIPVVAMVSLEKRNFESIYSLCFILFLFAPMSCLFGFDREKSLWPLFYCHLSLLIVVGVNKVRLSDRKRLKWGGSNSAAIYLALAADAFFVVASILLGGLSTFQFDIGSVYDFRDEASSIVDVGILAYTNLWTQKIFNPMLLAIGMDRRNYLLILISLAMQIFFFGMTQHRFHLFQPLIVIGMYFLYNRNWKISTFYVFFSIFLISVLIVSIAFGLNELPSLILRRAFFVPASATYTWIDFFKHAPFVYWTDNILSAAGLTEYNGVSLPWHVGYIISGGFRVAFNVGLIGTGIANAGILGLVFYSLVIGMFVRAVKALIEAGLPPFMPAAILIGPFRTAIADADLMTAIVSHGLLLGLLILWLVGPTEAIQPTRFRRRNFSAMMRRSSGVR